MHLKVFFKKKKKQKKNKIVNILFHNYLGKERSCNDE